MTREKIYISSCLPFKSGKKKDGSDWTIYHVRTPQDKTYSTFEKKYTMMVGQEVNVLVAEFEKGGHKYLSIVEPKKVQISQDDILRMLNDHETRIKELEDGRGANLGKVMKALKEDDNDFDNPLL